MNEPRTSSLKQDFRIFKEPAFLVVIGLIGLLSAGGAGLLVYSANKYGIPLSEYWR
jgi:hypothetical protein